MALPSRTVNLTELANDGTHFAQRDPETGLLQIINSISGDIVAVLGGQTLKRIPKETMMEERLLPDGRTVLVEVGCDPTAKSLTAETYHPWVVDQICQRLVEGETLKKICSDPLMPSYATLCVWKRTHPHIEKQLDDARKDRAEALRDKAMNVADELQDYKFPTQAAKLKVDTLQWAAGVDHAKFSPKSKVDVAVTTPTQIIVNTGIDRTPIESAPTVRNVEETK